MPSSEWLLVKTILQQAPSFDWSLQGFGMFRLYLDDEVRLHLWDSTYKVTDCTMIHEHPWDFHSDVIAGVVHNERFTVTDDSLLASYEETKIKAGEGAHVLGDSRRVYLRSYGIESYDTGEYYSQNADEIHQSIPEDGTVTLVVRGMRSDKHRDHALVYCVPSLGFVSAAPRKATYEEILGAARRSLERWFN